MIINMTEWRDFLLESSGRESLPLMTYSGLEYTNETVFDLVTLQGKSVIYNVNLPFGLGLLLIALNLEEI